MLTSISMSRTADYAYLSATDAHAALLSGAFSAVDYVSALLERAQQADEHLHAFLCLSPERALRSARRADRRRASGQNMTCGTCPIVVKKALEKVAGVSSITVDFDKKTATVTYDPDKASTARLAQATTEAGFPSRLIAQP
jgi:mercuric transport protein